MGISAFNNGLSRQGSAIIRAPLATIGRRWAALGDSISANAGITGTMIPPSNGFRNGGNSKGYQGWLMALSLGAIDIQPDANFSIAGNTTAQIASRVPQVLAYKPAWCIVEGGTNDPGNGVSVAQTIANLKGIYDALTAAGINIMAICVTPRGAPSGTYTTAELQNIERMNQFMRRYASILPNMVVVDPARTTFLNQSTNLPATAQTLDGLHPNQAGAQSWGQACLTEVTPFIQSTQSCSPLFYSINDTYDSVNNTAGNMIANGLFTTATGGTMTGNSVLTGSAPASWTVSYTKAGTTYTGTIALTNGSRTDATLRPGNIATLTAASLSSTTGGAQDYVQFFQQINFPTGLVPGDLVEGMVELFVNATSGLTGFDINIGQTDGNGTTYFATGFGPATDSSAWPQSTYHIVIKTPRMLIGPAAGASQRTISLFVKTYVDTTVATGSGTFVVSLASASLRKINGLV